MLECRWAVPTRRFIIMQPSSPVTFLGAALITLVVLLALLVPVFVHLTQVSPG